MKKGKIMTLGVIVIIICVLAFILGPVPKKSEVKIGYFDIPERLDVLNAWVKKDSLNPKIKPDNHSRIIWADSIRQTEYCILYLPGFTATYMEGEPLHKNIASKYGCNLYLPRFKKTGLKDVDAYIDLTISDLLTSAEEAYAIASRLGKRVIIISCSTGSSLGLYLASKHDLGALITYSPNIKLATPFAELLLGPWGLQIAKLAHGGAYRSYEQTDEYDQYWYTKYRVEGIITLQQLLKHTMTPETFEKVTCPLYVGYYYKNKKEKDEVVSISALNKMYNSVATDGSLKRIESFENVGHHAMISKLTSTDIESVELKLISFLDEVMGISDVN